MKINMQKYHKKITKKKTRLITNLPNNNFIWVFSLYVKVNKHTYSMI